MQFIGKIIGAALGYFLFNIPGAIFGLLIGHSFDYKHTIARSNETFRKNSNAQLIFFKATFTSMGHLAKSDGQVTETEIQVALSVMEHMRLNETQRRDAMRLFNQGKQKDYDFIADLTELREACGHDKPLLKFFLQFQFQAAYSDAASQLSSNETLILTQIATALGLSNLQFQRMNHLYRAQAQFRSRQHSGQYQQGPGATTYTNNTINQAYALLGVNKGSSKVEVKQAYRRLINQNHPDKLVAKGLPESMIKSANEKTQEIKDAYEQIKRFNNWR